jgi:hypothetical protein
MGIIAGFMILNKIKLETIFLIIIIFPFSLAFVRKRSDYLEGVLKQYFPG